jgi:hypothetical protein
MRVQVLVRVAHAGVNPVETYIRAGTYPVLPPTPYTPGGDLAGVVERVGANVVGVKVGMCYASYCTHSRAGRRTCVRYTSTIGCVRSVHVGTDVLCVAIARASVVCTRCRHRCAIFHCLSITVLQMPRASGRDGARTRRQWSGMRRPCAHTHVRR